MTLGVREERVAPVGLRGEHRGETPVKGAEIALAERARRAQRLQHAHVSLELRVHRGHEGAVAVQRDLREVRLLMLDQDGGDDEGESGERNDARDDEE